MEKVTISLQAAKVIHDILVSASCQGFLDMYVSNEVAGGPDEVNHACDELAAARLQAEKRQGDLRRAAEKAIEIYQAHDEAASLDVGFDAGELSGPAHRRMVDNEIVQLAAVSRFTVQEIDAEVRRLCQETEADDCPLSGKEGEQPEKLY